MSEELRPCPFCSTVPVIEDHSHRNDPDYWWLRCKKCGHADAPAGEKADVIKAWNNRPVESALRADLAATLARAEMAEETARVLAEQLGKGNLWKINECLEWADQEAVKRLSEEAQQ